eukprot:13033535-Heterocapsa_arctica.AAC.1
MAQPDRPYSEKGPLEARPPYLRTGVPAEQRGPHWTKTTEAFLTQVGACTCGPGHHSPTTIRGH